MDFYRENKRHLSDIYSYLLHIYFDDEKKRFFLSSRFLWKAFFAIMFKIDCRCEIGCNVFP